MKVRRLRNDVTRRGVAAVELAVLLPFFALMFSVAIDFAQIYFATQTLQNAAAAGAMYASGTSRYSTASGASGAAQDAACAAGASLSPALQASNVTVSSSGSGSATVTVQYAYTFLTPILGSSITLQRSATINQAPTPGS